MSCIARPSFSQNDILVLQEIDEKELQEAIDFLRTYTEVLWKNNDTGEIVPLSQLPDKLTHQPQPIYPEKLLEMGRLFANIRFPDKSWHEILEEEGFFDKNSIALRRTATLYSASFICARIADAYHIDRFCDGAFGGGVKDGVYLKMLLHLQDLQRYYKFEMGRE